MIDLTFTVNGTEHTLEVPTEESLTDILRNRLGLTGSKTGCGSGECGACTVLLDGKPVKGCLTWAASIQGSRILTIEGLSANGDPLHPVQEAFVEAGAIQCGFCTPGFVMATLGLLMENPSPTDDDIIEALSGNLCRCTGYETIKIAVRLAAEKLAVHETDRV